MSIILHSASFSFFICVFFFNSGIGKESKNVHFIVLVVLYLLNVCLLKCDVYIIFIGGTMSKIRMKATVFF